MWAAQKHGIRVRRAQHGPAAPLRSPRPALLLPSHPSILVLLINVLSITSAGECYVGITSMNGRRSLAHTGQRGGPPCAHVFFQFRTSSVSYTHLTLPTILRV